MGYDEATARKLLDVCKEVFGTSFQNISLLDFGDQMFYDIAKTKPYFEELGYEAKNTSEYFLAKPFLEFLGFEYTSIDYNGSNGALNLDVRKDITTKVGKYDVITNQGFSEHVGESTDPSMMLDSQYAIFKNMHDIGKADALYYHTVPLTHYWFQHGVCDYSLEFFAELCKVNNYTVIREPYIEDYHMEKQASVFYKKNGIRPFCSREEFAALPGLRSTANDQR